jgi:hypothetical protein
MRKEFKISITEEDGLDALEPYINGPDWKHVVWDFNELLRKKIKYDNLPDLELELYEKLREELFSIICEYDLTLG